MTTTVPDAGAPPLTPELEILRAVWELNHRLEVASSEMLRTIGVTAQQRMLLRVLASAGSMTAGALAATLHIHPGTLSSSLRRLEARGLLHRERAAEDARRIEVTVTRAGARIASKYEDTVEEATARLLRASPSGRAKSAVAFIRALSSELSGMESGHPRGK